MDLAISIIAVGAIVFLAHLFKLAFEHFRIPDILPLVVIGLILGPVTNLVSTDQFGEIGPVFANMTLVLILFESGLNMNLKALKSAVGPALKLGISGYLASALVVLLAGQYVFNLPFTTSLILGALLGGTAASVAVPLIKDLNMTKTARTSLTLESIFGNVLTIVVTLGLMSSIQEEKFRPVVVTGDIISTFVMGCLVGGLFGYLWCFVIAKVRNIEYSKFTTPAFVCIAFGVAKLFGFSGMMAALAFGIVLGNIRKLPSITENTEIELKSANQEEKKLFAELVFLMKTFFFVYLGMSMQWFGVELLYMGALITGLLLLVRPIFVKLSMLKEKQTTLNDLSIMSVMLPRGLASAVLASMALDMEIAQAATLQNLAYTVILLSIICVAVMTFACEKGWLIASLNKLGIESKGQNNSGKNSQVEEKAYTYQSRS